MTEKKLVAEGETISYKGIFIVNDVYKLIDNWFIERGWDKHDFTHEVINKEKSRDVILDLRPSKMISEYVKFRVKIKANFLNVTDKEIEINDKKIKVNEGTAKINFVGEILTDHEGDLKSQAWLTMIRTIFEKYIYKKHTEEYEKMLKEEIFRLRNEVSAFLNLKKYVN